MNSLIIVGYSILLLFIDASPEAITNISPSYVFENREAMRAACIHLELLDEIDYMYFKKEEDCISDAQTMAIRYTKLKDVPLLKEFTNFCSLSSKGIYPANKIKDAQILREYCLDKAYMENWRKEEWFRIVKICDIYIAKWNLISVVNDEANPKHYRREKLLELKNLITAEAFEFEIFPNEIPEEWFAQARTAKELADNLIKKMKP